MRLSPVALAALLACGGEDELRLGRFTVSRAGEALRFAHDDGLAIQSAPGLLARTREATASYEHQYGAFKILERSSGPAREATRVGALDGDTVELLDEAGELVATLELSEVQGSLQLVVRGDADRATLALACDGAEDGGYLGLGAQTADVDHRGQIVPLWVEEQGIGKSDSDEYPTLWPLVGTKHASYLPVPSLIAPRVERSYGLRSTNLERSVWDLCATRPDTLLLEAWAPSITVQLSPGPSALEVLAQQTTLSGRPPLGPEWTFGVWMEAIGGRQAVLDEVARLAEAQIPASAIWTEDWRGGARQGRSYALDEDWRADPVMYPDIAGLARDLEARGLRFMTYFNTFVVEGADVYEEALREGHLVKRPDGTPSLFDGVTFEPTGLADLYSGTARAWVKGELKAALAQGIDGWMADFAEWYPAEARDVAPPSGLSAPAAHNQYPVEWAKANREAVEESGRDDVVIFHRSGTTGSQGYAHVIWAGDQRTSFDADDGLPTVLPILLGLSMTGFPVLTHDIGGYISSTNPPTSRELFFRWTSLGALAPVMRTHHGRDVDYNWRWSRDEATRAHFLRWARWHMRHAPMWRGLARDAAERGAPILRPLALLDPKLSSVKDEYLVGDDYLVAPVLTASTTSRRVVFPPGRYLPVGGGPAIVGPTELEVAVPLEELALYLRAGAIVPQTAIDVPTLNRAEDLAELRARRRLDVALGADGRATDGDGGAWTLSSAGIGPIAAVEGGVVRVRTATIVVVEAPANGRLVLRGEDGGAHTLEGAGHSSALATVVRFLW